MKKGLFLALMLLACCNIVSSREAKQYICQSNHSVVVCPFCYGTGCATCGYSGYVVVTPTGVYPYTANVSNNDNSNNSNNNAATAERIRQLEGKRNSAIQDLQNYKERNDKNPTVSGSMLIRETQKLISTYEDQIYQLKRGY